MNDSRRARARDETHRPTVRTRASPLVLVAAARASPLVVASARVDVSVAPRGRAVARSVGRAVGRTRAETVRGIRVGRDSWRGWGYTYPRVQGPAKSG